MEQNSYTDLMKTVRIDKYYTMLIHFFIREFQTSLCNSFIVISLHYTPCKL